MVRAERCGVRDENTAGDGAEHSGTGAASSSGEQEGHGRRRFLARAAAVGVTGGLLGAAGAANADAKPNPRGGKGTLGPEDLDADRLLLIPDLVLLPSGPERGQAVLVERGTFKDIGRVSVLKAAHPDVRPVELPGQLLMPGFVDAHHHLTQSFGKALAFGRPSEIFKSVWEPLEHALDADSARLAAQLAGLEALRGGFTTVADAGTRAPVDVAVVAEGAQEAGIRCVLAKVVSDGKGGERHLSRWDGGTGKELIHPSLAIPVPENASDDVLVKTSALCAEADAVFQIHVNEHLASVERSLKDVGRRPVQHLHHIGALGPQLLGAHATLLTPEEMRMVADSGAALSYNPVASAWKGNAVAHATMWAALGIRFGTGTDGTRGDGFRVVDAAESAQRLTHGMAIGDSVCGGGKRWLEHATAKSADALGLGKVTGRVQKGYAADFLLVDIGDTPELTPSWDLLWELVRLTDRDQITAVFVAGRLCIWQGWPPHWDGRELVRRAARVGREVVRRAGLEPTAHRP
ncbi:amidohydrolase family protein [Streptomyces monticola]|uniref:Amidohydrolase family protein n=1 Tax=Streptomyces monticola TaxID=2666263 RepID=A0ABW2JP33_9ACTN